MDPINDEYEGGNNSDEDQQDNVYTNADSK